MTQKNGSTPEYVPAFFIDGPWAGRYDVKVAPGTQVVRTLSSLGEYRYRDHARTRDGVLIWFGYEWSVR